MSKKIKEILAHPNKTIFNFLAIYNYYSFLCSYIK